MDPVEPQPQEREPYEPPALLVIEMVAEEVMGLGCKTTLMGGGPLTDLNCMLASCFAFNGS